MTGRMEPVRGTCCDCLAEIDLDEGFFRCPRCVFALPSVMERGVTGAEMRRQRVKRDRALREQAQGVET